jgi:PAS domain S-box-containing protein
MLVFGIIAFLSGFLLLTGEAIWRSSRNREKQASLEHIRRDLAARLAVLESYYPQALVMMDSRGLIRRVNGAAERLFGYDEAELLGHSILRLLPSAPSALNPDAARFAAADAQDATEMEVRCKDRSTVKVLMTGTRSEREGESDIYMFFEAADAQGQPELEQLQSRRAAAGG